ncbi:uncharacterized protein LOC126335746 [Schistocerca gregaria]|uniref:uncharacterized protein LOC126335746 n=1 Tax=Schistocerca gregaria TaxID=7010 RepID=UPI00211DF2C3|nr:uncharacterized protein LOC126335746 [Schistocerca gregaria]
MRGAAGRGQPSGGRRRRLMTRVLNAVREMGGPRGCSAKQILNILNNDASSQVDKARLVTTLKRGVETGALSFRAGRYKPGARSTGWREICCRKRPAKWRARCRRMFSRPCRKLRRRRSCRRRRRRSCRRRRRSCRRRRRRSCRRRKRRRRRRRCSYDDMDPEPASLGSRGASGGGNNCRSASSQKAQQK